MTIIQADGSYSALETSDILNTTQCLLHVQ